MIAYLAQPIDRSTDGVTAGHAVTVRSMLLEAGLTVFSPYLAWGSKKPPPSRVQRVNESALRDASVLVVVMMEADHSLGVPFEMALAREWNIPMVVVTDIKPENSVILRHSGAYIFDPRYRQFAVDKAYQVALGKRDQQIAKWQPLSGGVAPRAGKEGDAGFDLHYSGSEPLTIQPGEMVNVEAGIGVEFPPGVWCLILGRSSTFQRRMFVAPSVIDAGYRGELFACVQNIGEYSQTIEPGERVAQIVPFDLVANRYRWIEGTLSDSERGATGFGSTGR